MDKESYIDIFAGLGAMLEDFGRDSGSHKAIDDAVRDNPWFTEREIVAATRALGGDMLRRPVLEKWLSGYGVPYSPPKDIAVIMAGNIPFAGFTDMMCIIVSGHRCFIKPSGKDTVLMEYLAGILREALPPDTVCDFSDRAYDAVIASGSDNSGKYFRSVSKGSPALLRGSRYSVAVMDGSENVEELRGLSDDIFLYSGMGCRSVSLLFIPRGYNTAGLCFLAPGDGNVRLRNNYRQEKAVMSMRGMDFIDGGCFLLSEQRSFPYLPGVINYTFYDSPDEVLEWLSENSERIQCVVSGKGEYLRGAVFGRAQHPAPWDYPDGEDVMEFLKNI